MALLVSWHADPDVKRYWDDETFNADELRERIARTDVDTWIVEEDGEAVGLLQSWWEADPPRRGGIDGFLVPSARAIRSRISSALNVSSSQYRETSGSACQLTRSATSSSVAAR